MHISIGFAFPMLSSSAAENFKHHRLKPEDQEGADNSSRTDFVVNDSSDSSSPSTRRADSSAKSGAKKRQKRSPGVSRKHRVETLVVADSYMFDYHGSDIQHYVLTLMSIVSIVSCLVTCLGLSYVSGFGLSCLTCLALVMGQTTTCLTFGLACPALSCLALPVLSCLVLSCPVLSCLASLVLPVFCLVLLCLSCLSCVLPYLSCVVLPVLSWWCESCMLWLSCSDTQQHIFTLLSCLLARLVVRLVWLVLSWGWRSDTHCTIAAARTVRHNVLIYRVLSCLFHWLCFPPPLALPCLWWVKLGV